MNDNYRNQNNLNNQNGGGNNRAGNATGGVYSGNSGVYRYSYNQGTQNQGTQNGAGAVNHTWNTQNYSRPQNQNTKKKKGGFKKVLVSAGLGLCFGICAGLSFYAVDKLLGRDEAAIQTAVVAEVEETAAATEEAVEEVKTVVASEPETVTSTVTDVTQVVDKVMPAMVSIVNTYTENISYFGQNYSQEGSASGSGIIIGQNDKELLIVTNYHVIEDAENLAVSFVDDAAATAQVKGTDSSMDLAVIAVPLEDLTEETKNSIAVAQLGDSDSLQLGEAVIAIGNALGYGQSVTTGVVSALDREIAVSDTSTGTFIQTNAAINPGNSGGALLNMKGEVIGINSNKIGGSSIEGMGYAIPISDAKSIIEELMNRETKTKVDKENMGYLGITGVTVTSDVAAIYDMPEGVYVTQVYRGTGAEAAGITKGTIITKLDGVSISNMDDLMDGLQYYAVGDKVEVTIMQRGASDYEEKTVTVTLGIKIE